MTGPHAQRAPALAGEGTGRKSVGCNTKNRPANLLIRGAILGLKADFMRRLWRRRGASPAGGGRFLPNSGFSRSST